ncbi:MAG: sugar ABC transporter ATP-binding protein, partial [Actinobacteria bacterium]|nr:sugar ABC transporter ATP-binding protein [Actinomycetota bacterium]MBU2384581.1 sugar ABC transporter ATP-binding protein [Actinomycetota bacterium]
PRPRHRKRGDRPAHPRTQRLTHNRRRITDRYTTTGDLTNGVDVGAKAEIYRIIEDLTEQGVSVLLISDDLPEILALADRIVVMKDGGVATRIDVHPDNPPTEVQIVAAMV